MKTKYNIPKHTDGAKVLLRGEFIDTNTYI